LFYLPDSRDLVDPDYDFIADTYGPNRQGVETDVYAHQLYPKPNADGILVSKSVLSARLMEKAKQIGGIHALLRLPPDIPVMGDCGAFQYLSEEQPIYTTEEICTYYDSLGFDQGISVDHIILEFDAAYDSNAAPKENSVTPEMRRRYEVTLANAREMLERCSLRSLSFEPIGSAQGWSPLTYRSAIEDLVAMGYRNVALGGLAKASDKDIKSVLTQVGPVVRQAGVSLHVLGVARKSMLAAYREAGVSSCDSTAPLFQAFKSSVDNYHTPEKNYTAVRIPPVAGNMSPKVRKLLRKYTEAGNTTGYAKEFKRLSLLERQALNAIRTYATGDLSLAQAMRKITRYEDEFEEPRRHRELFQKTLADRPWEDCPCPVCRSLGVEVILLRGNNRNRRRGFHNTYVFFQEFKRLTGRR